jgi:hypothetical protein
MAQNFIACDREQVRLLPPSVRDWLPDDHLALFMTDASIEQTVAARRRRLGLEHPETLTSMNNLAATLGALGDHARARLAGADARRQAAAARRRAPRHAVLDEQPRPDALRVG